MSTTDDVIAELRPHDNAVDLLSTLKTLYGRAKEDRARDNAAVDLITGYLLAASQAAPAPGGEGAQEIIAHWIMSESDRWDLDDEGFLAATDLLATLAKKGFTLAASPAPSRSPGPDVVRWRHKKRGTTYTRVGMAQVQAPEDAPLTDYECVEVYRGDNQLWVRRCSEFREKFEQVAASQAAPAPGGEGWQPPSREELAYHVCNIGCGLVSECRSREIADALLIKYDIRRRAALSPKDRADG